MMKKMDNKTVLITGGSKGIGRSMSKKFSQQGASVIFTYSRDKSYADSLCEEISNLGGVSHSICIDHDSQHSAKEIYNLAVDKIDKIDVLINNVGIFHRSTFLDITEAQYDSVLYANLRVPFFLSQLIAKNMINNEVQGSIINVSSLSASFARSRMAHYQCSKAALTNLSRSLAFELGEHGIRVNTISPGLTATDANKSQWDGNSTIWKERSSDIPLKRAGLPDDHAGAAIFLASDDAKYITGADITIDGGMSVY